MNDASIRKWFEQSVLPHEAGLLAFLRANSREHSDVKDMLHDIYERALGSAKDALPRNTRAYLFIIARNILIDRARRARVVSLELYADIEQADIRQDWITPERQVSGIQELERMLTGLSGLPPRCREIVRLRKLEGLSTKEVAQRLGIGTDAVERQLVLGMRALTDFMLGGQGRVRRDKAGTLALKRKGPFRVW